MKLIILVLTLSSCDYYIPQAKCVEGKIWVKKVSGVWVQPIIKQECKSDSELKG